MKKLTRESKKRQTPTSAIYDSGTPTQGFKVPAIPGTRAYKKLRAAASSHPRDARRGGRRSLRTPRAARPSLALAPFT